MIRAGDRVIRTGNRIKREGILMLAHPLTNIKDIVTINLSSKVFILK